ESRALSTELLGLCDRTLRARPLMIQGTPAASRTSQMRRGCCSAAVDQAAELIQEEEPGGGLVGDRSLHAHTGEGANLHLGLQLRILVTLAKVGAHDTGDEASWDGNQTRVGQREPREVHVREHRGLRAGD